MNELSALTVTIWRDAIPYFYGAVLILAAILYRSLVTERVTLKHSLLFFVGWVLLDVVAAVFSLRGDPSIAWPLHQLALLGFGLVLIRLSGLVLFRVLQPALKISSPRIVEDIVVIGGYMIWGMVHLSMIGVELSSLVATSAVITAVIAFAMQDTLGNILGGLALQLDNSLEVGNWVKMGDLSGKVIEIQWRYTAILTRNGEKVIVPNSQLMKGSFSVISDRNLQISGWRRWVWFNIDYSASPASVIRAAEQSLADAGIANVAQVPGPSCVAMEFLPGSVRYALRYWLLDPQEDDTTDSMVRSHLLAMMGRHGWSIALPDQSVHIVQEDEMRQEALWQRELQRRLQILSGIELFAMLDDAERRQLAHHLVPAPFVQGGVITRQGAVAHWLYVIVSGEADAFWAPPVGERRLLTHLPQGSVFGEMGLMTGAPRAATVVASTDCECYRLDKASFEQIIRARPELAEAMSHILAERQQQLDAMFDAYQKNLSDSDQAAHRAALLERIRDFFGLHHRFKG